MVEPSQQSLVVEPPDPLQRVKVDVLEAAPPPTLGITSGLNKPMTDLANVLSHESPRLSTDGSMPLSRKSSVYRIERYRSPRSPRCARRASRDRLPSRWQLASLSASRARSKWPLKRSATPPVRQWQAWPRKATLMGP